MRFAVVDEDSRIRIASDEDILAARQMGRSVAIRLGFSAVDATLIASAISELARNILAYARAGEIRVQAVSAASWDGVPPRRGIQVLAHDEGPGIRDVKQALRDGFSTSGSLGLGLPGVRRLADEFNIVSAENRGTTVTVRKWQA